MEKDGLRPASARVGRALSIVGHPFILIPLAVTIATWRASSRSRVVILSLLALCMTAVAVHVVRRHRRGEISDIDVSQRQDRPKVFRVAILSLVLVMIVLAATHASQNALRGTAVTTALFIGCAIVNQRLKASLHTAFAMLAAGIVWPANALAGACFAAFALVIGWGRVAYGRHTTPEVIAGTLLGSAAAVALAWWVTQP